MDTLLDYQINYCKAYQLRQLSHYVDWQLEIELNIAPPNILFLHTDYVVRLGSEIDSQTVFSDNTPAWLAFCQNELAFNPDDIVA